jgi:hypothetical protein
MTFARETFETRNRVFSKNQYFMVLLLKCCKNMVYVENYVTVNFKHQTA